MVKLDPSFAVHGLQQLGPGTFVIYQQAGAFVGLNRSAPAAVGVSLAVHDAQHHLFAYHYFSGAQPSVLVPRAELIIRPSLLSLKDNVPVQPPSDKLFIEGEKAWIVVSIPDSGQVRLLNLADGSLVTPMVSNMDAFDSWEVGVASMGEFQSLLKV
jgi:hypothetical protein